MLLGTPVSVSYSVCRSSHLPTLTLTLSLKGEGNPNGDARFYTVGTTLTTGVSGFLPPKHRGLRPFPNSVRALLGFPRS